jgi:CRP-like cAMP-binding protein
MRNHKIAVMPLDHLRIKNYLLSFNILTDEEIENFLQQTSQRTLQKGEYFIREGQICKEVAFVFGGNFRSYYTSNGGEEFTYCITFPNNFMTAYSSFITGERTEENIQAINDTQLLIIPKSKIDILANESPNW